MTAVEIYHYEKAKRAGRVSAQLAEVRAIIARIEAQDEQHRNGGTTRRAARKAASPAPREPKPEPMTFKCGHPRSPENAYMHTKPGRAGYKECKTCAKARSSRRDRTGESRARFNRQEYDRERYAANAERLKAEARERWHNRKRKRPTIRTYV